MTDQKIKSNIRTHQLLWPQDYQIILFTHDLYSFRKMQRRFLNWMMKKIKYWDYTGGPEMDIKLTTEKEIETLLKNPTKSD